MSVSKLDGEKVTKIETKLAPTFTFPDSNAVHVTSQGSIVANSGESPIGILSSTSGNKSITVDGSVAGLGWGVKLEKDTDAARHDTLSINGTVSSDHIGIELANAATLTNTGTIQGGDGGGVLALHNLTLVNTGTIKSTAYAGLSGGSKSLDVLNKGTIEGGSFGIEGSTAGDIVRNEGHIAGAKGLSLGDGNDHYDGRKGEITGQLLLGAGGDTAFGGAKDEEIFGLAGNDLIEGGGGRNLLDGGADNDTALYTGSAAAHVDMTISTYQNTKGYGWDWLIDIENLEGGSGSDSFKGNAFNNKLIGNDGKDTLQGGGGNDTLDGGSDDDMAVFSGRKADYTITKNADGTFTVQDNVSLRDGQDLLKDVRFAQFADQVLDFQSASPAPAPVAPKSLVLMGSKGKNTLVGGAGDDKLNGGYGNDRMTGADGKDVFVFNSKLGTSKTDRKVNFDTITDFDVKNDTIWLDNKIFTKLGKGTEFKLGKLQKKFFNIGSKADDENDYINYNAETGIVTYDKDGDGTAYDPVEIMKLDRKLKLTADDFKII